MTDVIERYLPDRIKGFYNRKGKNKLICFEKKIKHYKQIIQENIEIENRKMKLNY